MLHLRLFDLSTASLAAASGVAAWNLPQPAGALLGGALALTTLGVMTLRDGIAPVPPRPKRSILAPFESARELVRERDAAPSTPPANSNLTPYQAGRTDYRLAPETDHVFKYGDQVEFIVDAWDAGELIFSGTVEAAWDHTCKVRVDHDEKYLVPREYIVLIEAAR